MSETSLNTDQILARMQSLRAEGRRDVERLHEQAERVTDWKEHVRAQPMVAAAAASLLGFLVVRSALSSQRASTVPVQPLGASSSTGLLAFAGGLASNLGRQWLTHYVQRELGNIRTKKMTISDEPSTPAHQR